MIKTRRRNLEEIKSKNSGQEIAHIGLWLDKFICGREEERTNEQSKKDERKPKSVLIKELTEIQIPSFYKQLFKQWEKNLEEFGVEFRKVKITERMIIGLGTESVLETGISLHRTYGVPFIPGSAVKGLAAKYSLNLAIQDENWKNDGKMREFIFGSQKSAGFVTFHDALLVIEENDSLKSPLHQEIMTVHHPDYYGDKNAAPADWDSPNPIPFLSASGSYRLAISVNFTPQKSEEEQFKKDVINQTFRILRYAFSKEGIGAKTSSGYGRGEIEKTAEELDEENKQLQLIEKQRRKDQELEKQNQALINFSAKLKMFPSERLPSEIGNFVNEWRNFENNEQKKTLAQEIIDKVREAKRENAWKEKKWFIELQDFINGDNSE